MLKAAAFRDAVSHQLCGSFSDREYIGLQHAVRSADAAGCAGFPNCTDVRPAVQDDVWRAETTAYSLREEGRLTHGRGGDRQRDFLRRVFWCNFPATSGCCFEVPGVNDLGLLRTPHPDDPVRIKPA